MSTEVRDAIHGLIKLSPVEWQLVDTKAFQRLRGIGQLAMTYLVYPSARHSRFEHSIGTCHVAGRLAKELKLPAEEEEFVRLAALAHDIGHGPFSHVSEKVLKRNQKIGHEHVSAAVIRHDEKVNSLLGSDRASRIADLLVEEGEGKKRSIERDIISGSADADKLDYLLRDSYFCGVEYGRYDLDKVIEAARAAEEYSDVFALGFHRDSVFALEEMVLARHHMHRQVYGHKTRLATDEMLVTAMNLAIDEEVLPSDVFAPAGELDSDFVEEYLTWDDGRVTRELCQADGKRCQEVMQALLDRRLYKRVYNFSSTDLEDHFPLRVAVAAAFPEDLLPEEVALAEQGIAESIGLAPHWVKLRWVKLENPLASPVIDGLKGGGIVLVDDEGKTISFIKESEIFEDSTLPARAYVSLFARPAEDCFSDEELKKLHDATLEALEIIGKTALEV